MPRPRPSLAEHNLDLLERLASRLGVGEESLNRGADAEHAEYDEELPGDVFEAGRNEEPDCEVEEPWNCQQREYQVIMLTEERTSSQPKPMPFR